MTQITRREAREQAFALVFEMIFSDAPVQELVEGAAQCRDISVSEYAIQAAQAVRDHWWELDETIDRFSDKWKVGRLPTVTALPSARSPTSVPPPGRSSTRRWN